MDNQTNDFKSTIDLLEIDEEFVVDKDDCSTIGTCNINGCRLRFNSEEDLVENTESNNNTSSEEAEVEKGNDLLNENDEDEATSETKIYIISIDGIPFYYESLLADARNQLLNIANYYVGKLNSNDGPGHIIVSDNNLRQVKIVAPYTFLFLTYNHVIHELTLDYATKLPQ
jgi:hypothetical protein